MRRSVIIAELWRPEIVWIGKFSGSFCFFWKNDPLWQNFQNSVRFTSRHRSTLLCAKFVKIVRREIGESVRNLPDQKNTFFRLPLKLSLLRGSRPKSATASPQHLSDNRQLSNFYPNRFTVGGVIARRVKAVKNAVLGEPMASHRVNKALDVISCNIYRYRLVGKLDQKSVSKSGTGRILRAG